MEELRSTEVLDKEIREDARKKAEKILARAKESVEQELKNVGQRISEAEAEARKASAARVAAFEKNNIASLPLEKQRYVVSFVRSQIIKAVNEWLAECGDAKRLEIISGMIRKAEPVLTDVKKIDALVTGMRVPDAERILSALGKSLSSVSEADEDKFADEHVPGLLHHEGIVLSCDDGKIICRLTLDEKIREVLDSHSEELALALFKGRIPE